MMREVPASEFARNFGRYRELAQREPIAVTSHGRTTGYFVSAEQFERLQQAGGAPAAVDEASRRAAATVAGFAEVDARFGSLADDYPGL